jgi:transposase
VQATGTSLTEMFGVGPFIAATVIGEAGDVSRFASRDAFASYNGTAPMEVSSGRRTVHRLSLRGNRRLNHAAHMTAVTQVRYPRTQGRAYFDKKVAEGKTAKEALVCGVCEKAVSTAVSAMPWTSETAGSSRRVAGARWA